MTVIKKTVYSKEIEKHDVIGLNFNFSSADVKYFLLRGVVIRPSGIPLPHAAVEIILIEKEKPDVTIGVTFSMEDGSYGISLPYIIGASYKIISYST